MGKLKNKAASLLLGCMALATIFTTNFTFASVNAEANQYKISGYIDPDLSFINQDLRAGFSIELIGYSLQTTSNSEGYFELSGIPLNSSEYTVKISKEGYLYRQITGVKVLNNLLLGSQSEPIKMWAGDMKVNNVQDNAINITDVMEVAKHFNCTSGDEKYDIGSDINRDSAVNITDIMIVANHFNKDPSSYPELKINNPTDLKVIFIDVGKGDSILVKAPNGKSMLVDAGKSIASASVTSRIKSEGFYKIDVLVGTHPHGDHIGGMNAVINSFDIGKMYLPKVASTTEHLDNLLATMKNKGLKADTAKAGDSIDLDPDLKVDILAPKRDSYQDENDYSIVIKLTYKNTSFLLGGDASAVSEGEMLAAGYDLKADVLKVGHHGSYKSTSADYLKAVSPRFAVISVDAGNDSGYPTTNTLNKLAAANVQVFRTDKNGTITASSDGNTVVFN